MSLCVMERESAERGADLTAWLGSGQAFGGGVPAEQIHTHASTVFLQGDRAWKIKRPIHLDYLDCSTPEKRRAILETELRLNRRTAPDLYLAVHSITMDSGGRFALDGSGGAIDWVLEMKRFPSDALLERQFALGAVDDPALVTLADAIIDLHRRAEICINGRGHTRLEGVIDGNTKAMARFPEILPADRVKRLTDRLIALTRAHAALLDARGRTGRIRHGHGDLHLGNIALVDGRPLLFDCLEFDADLATGDVLYDLSFLLMDLCVHGRRHAANLVFNRYFDRCADDEEGLSLLPLFFAVRACVRAHVLAARAEGEPSDQRSREKALGYLAYADRMTLPGSPRLIAVGGLSGVGKSTLARAIGGCVGLPPGARILRSDVLRKRMNGVEADVRLPADCYTPQANREVYAEMRRLAANALSGGHSAILDATFVEPEERARAGSLAVKSGCKFDGLWLQMAEQDRLTRVAGRAKDASDADVAVARSQAIVKHPKPSDWACLEAGPGQDLLRAGAAITLDLGACACIG